MSKLGVVYSRYTMSKCIHVYHGYINKLARIPLFLLASLLCIRIILDIYVYMYLMCMYLRYMIISLVYLVLNMHVSMYLAQYEI